MISEAMMTISDSMANWELGDRDPELFDRIIPEPRWSYAIHRLEFFEKREPWEPKEISLEGLASIC